MAPKEPIKPGPVKVGDIPPNPPTQEGNENGVDVQGLLNQNARLLDRIEELQNENQQLRIDNQKLNTPSTPPIRVPMNEAGEAYADIYQVLAQVARGSLDMLHGKQTWRRWLASLSADRRKNLVEERNNIARRMSAAAEGLGQDLQSLTE